MAMVSSTLASNLSQTFPSKDESFVSKLADSNRNLSSSIDSDKNLQSVDGEIGVFGAEKYFNAGIYDELPESTPMAARKYQYNKDEEDDSDHQMRPKNRPETPSVGSESSWTSQTALLQNFLRNSCKSDKINGKSFLTNFTCKCYCSAKTSVDVNEDFRETSFNKAPNFHGKLEILRTGSNGEPCFTFPNSSFAGKSPLKVQFQAEEDEKERKSLEVFGFPAMGKRNKSLSIERSLSLFSWDSNSQAKVLEYNDMM